MVRAFELFLQHHTDKGTAKIFPSNREEDNSEVDSAEVDSNEVDSNEVDSEEVDSEEVDSEEVNYRDHDKRFVTIICTMLNEYPRLAPYIQSLLFTWDGHPLWTEEHGNRHYPLADTLLYVELAKFMPSK